MTTVLPVLPLLQNYDIGDDAEENQPQSGKQIIEADKTEKVKKSFADKGTTVAERVVWMSRTSDVLGSHYRSDLESYMELIRRRIQEKCATTVELITQIRRCKISEAAAVTPNEFRFTLIKFGITLDQSIVNRIFKIFDSDGSGTMDFDEFAMWIMNSEFQPKENIALTHKIDSPRTALRKKFLACVNAHSKCFANMKKQISIIEFISEIQRKNMNLTEREARSVFQILDSGDTGYVNSAALVDYAKSGMSEFKVAVERAAPIAADSLEDLLRKVVGRNTNALEQAFSHVTKGAGTKVAFDEFRRCLLNAGTGKNILDVRQVYNALGGKAYGGADIDLLFTSLSPIIKDPRTEMSVKQGPSPFVSASRADRFLRESIRKSYKEVRNRIAGADPQLTGYISSEKLYRIIVKKCTPLTLQDFRFITTHITKSADANDQTKIDYNHFLHAYNPKHVAHQLDGLMQLRTYSPSKQAPNSSESEHSRGSRLNTAPGLEGMSLSSSLDSSLSNAARQMRSSNRAATASGGSRGGNTSTDMLKKIWHSVLRECHRSDPDRIGQVSKAVFVAAVQTSDTSKTMTQADCDRLASTYQLPNGRVNYLLCFRNYLSELTHTSSTLTLMADSAMSLSRKEKPDPNSLSISLGTGSFPLNKEAMNHTHPWQFTYSREKRQDPYWQSANNIKQQTAAPSSSTQLSPLKTSQTGTYAEKQRIAAQFKPDTFILLKKTYDKLAPIWKQLRATLKKAQIKTQAGSIMLEHFVKIVEDMGVTFKNNDLSLLLMTFRGKGLIDVLRFDEMLNACAAVKYVGEMGNK